MSDLERDTQENPGIVFGDADRFFDNKDREAIEGITNRILAHYALDEAEAKRLKEFYAALDKAFAQKLHIPATTDTDQSYKGEDFLFAAFKKLALKESSEKHAVFASEKGDIKVEENRILFKKNQKDGFTIQDAYKMALLAASSQASVPPAHITLTGRKEHRDMMQHAIESVNAHLPPESRIVIKNANTRLPYSLPTADSFDTFMKNADVQLPPALAAAFAAPEPAAAPEAEAVAPEAPEAPEVAAAAPAESPPETAAPAEEAPAAPADAETPPPVVDAPIEEPVAAAPEDAEPEAPEDHDLDVPEMLVGSGSDFNHTFLRAGEQRLSDDEKIPFNDLEPVMQQHIGVELSEQFKDIPKFDIKEAGKYWDMLERPAQNVLLHTIHDKLHPETEPQASRPDFSPTSP